MNLHFFHDLLLSFFLPTNIQRNFWIGNEGDIISNTPWCFSKKSSKFGNPITPLIVVIKILQEGLNQFMKTVSTSGLWITWMSWRTPNVCPTTSPWLRSRKMSAVKTDQFRLGLWEFKSKVCFYSQEICDTWCVKIMNKQREFTDKMLYNCARLRVRRTAVWVMDKWLLDQWKWLPWSFIKYLVWHVALRIFSMDVEVVY